MLYYIFNTVSYTIPYTTSIPYTTAYTNPYIIPYTTLHTIPYGQHYLYIFYLKLQNCITFLQQWTIYELNALTRDHVNNFWDTSTPIHQAKSLVGNYTGPDAGRVNNYIYTYVWIIKALSSFDYKIHIELQSDLYYPRYYY